MLEYWIVNMLVFSIAPLSYICINLYKDKKKKQNIIDTQNRVLAYLEQKLKDNNLNY